MPNIDILKPYKPYWPGRSNLQGNAPDMRCNVNKRWRKELRSMVKGKTYICKINAKTETDKVLDKLFFE